MAKLSDFAKPRKPVACDNWEWVRTPWPEGLSSRCRNCDFVRSYHKGLPPVTIIMKEDDLTGYLERERELAEFSAGWSEAYREDRERRQERQAELGDPHTRLGRRLRHERMMAGECEDYR